MYVSDGEGPSVDRQTQTQYKHISVFDLSRLTEDRLPCFLTFDSGLISNRQLDDFNKPTIIRGISLGTGSEDSVKHLRISITTSQVIEVNHPMF